MFISLFGAVESGIIYAIMALGVYLSFRVLDFPDLTVDGSFVTGAAVGGVLILNGVPPILATILAAVAGFIAGCITGILHTKGKVNPLLSGILMMIALYSVNLRIMSGSPQISLLGENTLFKQLADLWSKTGIDNFLNNIVTAVGIENTPFTWSTLIWMLIVTVILKMMLDFFLKTEVGLAIRATGDNQRMIRSFSANTDILIIMGLGISNGLVALSGSLIAQSLGFADVGMGIGMIIIGLASVIIGEALFGIKTIARTTLAVIVGSIVYKIVVTLAIQVEFLQTGDMKLITALLVIIALVAPKIIQSRRDRKRKLKKRAQIAEETEGVQ